MKFYHANGQFFTMKADANDARKSAGLPPDALHTLTISNREEICEFLNGLVGHTVETPFTFNDVELTAVATVDSDVVPDYIPRFLLSQEQRATRDAQV